MEVHVCVWEREKGLEEATEQGLKEWSVLITKDVTDCSKTG